MLVPVLMMFRRLPEKWLVQNVPMSMPRMMSSEMSSGVKRPLIVLSSV